MNSDRRDFLRQLTFATAAVGGGAMLTPLSAEETDRAVEHLGTNPPWDMAWVDLVQRAQYKAVFDSTNLS